MASVGCSNFLSFIVFFKTKPREWPIFYIRPVPPLSHASPSWKGKRGGEYREKANGKLVFSCHLFSLLLNVPRALEAWPAQSVADREGCDLFPSPNALRWHVAKDPDGKAPNKKAVLAHGFRPWRRGTALAATDCSGTSRGSFMTLSHPSRHLGRSLITPNDSVSTAMAKSSVSPPWPGTAQS